jgi:hypothetical protein
MSWNYRVIRKTTHMGSRAYYSYSIYEVYYDENNRVTATSEEPIYPSGETVIELMHDIYAMFRAFTQPILEWDLVFRKGLEPSMHELREAKTFTHEWVPPTKEEIRKIEYRMDCERIRAEAEYKKECCNKSLKDVFEFLESTK